MINYNIFVKELTKVEPIDKKSNFYEPSKKFFTKIKAEKKPQESFDKLLKESLKKLDKLENRLREKNLTEKNENMSKKKFLDRYNFYNSLFKRKEYYNLTKKSPRIIQNDTITIQNYLSQMISSKNFNNTNLNNIDNYNIITEKRNNINKKI